MKNTIKLLGIITFISGVILSFSGCFSPYRGDEGFITISFGSNARAAAWPPTDGNGVLPALEHRVTLKGTGATKTHTIPKGTTTAKFSVAPGLWEITVEAWFGSVLFATGFGDVEVKVGEVNTVPITMTQEFDGTLYVASTTTEWGEAVGDISGGGGYYIIFVTNDFSAPGYPSANTFGNASGINVTIIGNKTITLNSTGSLLRIGTGQNVTINDVKLKGQGASVQNTTSLVYINGGTFTMNGSASVYDNTASFTSILDGGGGVYVTDGAFNMNGGTVSGNYATGTNVGMGGGVFVYSGGNFTMSGNAKVYNNKAEVNGGGVCLSGTTDQPTFRMNNGTIYGNQSIGGTQGGGGVCVSTGTFRMVNGTIYGNIGAPNGNTSPTGSAALYKASGSAAAEYGTYDSGGNWFLQGSFGIYENDTIIVKDGNKL